MSEQDATESDASTGDAPDEGGASPGTDEQAPDSPADGVEGTADTDSSDADGSEPSPGDADLDDIAAEPEGDIAEVLADLTTGAVEPDDQLIEHVEDSDPEAVAAELAALREQVATLEDDLAERDEEIDDLESRLKRKQADFQNYKKRQKERTEQKLQRATEDLVERLLDVRDNLERALEQDEDADIRSGVESTLRQFDEQLRRENVDPIDPEPGDETDPQRHETLATIAGDQPEGTIAEVHRPGYEMAEKVLRPAQVAVSDGSEHEGDDEAAEADGDAAGE